MREIVRMRFGSHLYGTDTPESDIDVKGVFTPSREDILWGETYTSISNARPKGEGEKNYAGEIDTELYSLRKYCDLLSQGQTVALDMLFCPNPIMTTWEWDEIKNNKRRFLSRKANSFIGYCMTQAAKYGIKGSRVAAVRAAVDMLEDKLSKFPKFTKLGEFKESIEILTNKHLDHMSIEAIQQVNGEFLLHWRVNGKYFAYTASIETAYMPLKKAFNEYGKRALLAEQQEGIDWKALSHAVRVANEALELLATNNITFPLKNREHILDIKKGRVPYQEVAKEIEDLIVKVKEAEVISDLPLEPDMKWIKEFVIDAHKWYISN